MSEIATFTIGRGQGCEIHIDDPSVSRRHAELVVASGPVYFLTDCQSSYGTHCVQGGDWAPIRQAVVQRGDQVRLGNYVATIGDLLDRARRPADLKPGTMSAIEPRAADFDDRPAGAVRRNPQTGEIEGL